MRVPIAILLHQFANGLPNGSEHFDVLVAPHDGGLRDDDCVVDCWRVAERPDQLPHGSTITMELIGKHRAVYLRLASPRELSDNRGTVTPLRHGSAERVDAAHDIRLAIGWDDGGRSEWTLTSRDGRYSLAIIANSESARQPSQD